MTLPGNLALPRADETREMCEKLAKAAAIRVIGESGAGKSALVKPQAVGVAVVGAESVWIRADQFGEVLRTVPDFAQVLRRTRRTSALLVFDALKACYDKEILDGVGRVLTALSEEAGAIWRIVLICQTPEWSRVIRVLVKTVAGHRALSERVECGELSKNDLALVCKQSASIHRLMLQGHLRRLLGSVKMLDVLLSGQLAEERTLAGEADLVEWWWNEQVRGTKQFAAEESIARLLGMKMADALVTEVSPDGVKGPADAVDALIHNRVLRRTQDGRLRFDHDLLADWSRVMHLRSLGQEVFEFMLAHAENPPWLRAIRLLSQHLLERTADLEQWRAIVKSCSATKSARDEPPAQNLQVLDAWLGGIAYCAEARKVLDTLKSDLLSNGGSPILDFLATNKSEATDHLPVELAEVAAMWARLEEYLGIAWPVLVDTILLNTEKELRREVAGEYRHDRGSRGMFGANNSRVAIYTAALHAASQFPDRAAKLVLKAAGRAPWEEGDVNQKADEGWRGEWHDRSPFGTSGVYVKQPPEPWPDGPKRRVSRDFFHAWFESNAALALYKNRTGAACEAALAFLLIGQNPK